MSSGQRTIACDYDRSIADFDKAIEFNPQDCEAYGSCGPGYSRKGEYDRTIADYTKSIEINISKDKLSR